MYNKEVQTMEYDEDEGERLSLEQLRAQIRQDLEAQQAQRDRELEEESEKLDREIEEEIRGLHPLLV